LKQLQEKDSIIDRLNFLYKRLKIVKIQAQRKELKELIEKHQKKLDYQNNIQNKIDN